MKFELVAARLFNTSLLLLPSKAAVLAAVVAPRLKIGPVTINGENARASDDDDELVWGSAEPETSYDQVGGIAVIPIRGTLVQRTGSVRPVSGLTGYDGIREAFNLALDDDAIRAIVLDIDSPGGEVAGCFDLADLIYTMRGVKPVRAILGENAFSAAYAIASAAEWITVPRTGGTGSVGVICMHVDFSKALAQAGIAVTMISYGAHKSEGSEFEPLSDPALARFQADVNAMGELFVETVARNRGLSADAVRGTEANTFLGAKGVEAGFADAVMAPDEAFRELLTQL